jgi:hypothetical protein
MIIMIHPKSKFMNIKKGYDDDGDGKNNYDDDDDEHAILISTL